MGAGIFYQREGIGASPAAATAVATGHLGMAAMAVTGKTASALARLGLRQSAIGAASAAYLQWLGIFPLYPSPRHRRRRRGTEFSPARPLFTKRIGIEHAISIFFSDQNAAGRFLARHHRLSLGGRDRGVLPSAAHDHRRV